MQPNCSLEQQAQNAASQQEHHNKWPAGRAYLALAVACAVGWSILLLPFYVF